MRDLPRHSGGLKINCGRIAFVSKCFEKLALHDRICNLVDRIEIELALQICLLQLILGQGNGLFRKHLRSQVSAPLSPIAFLTNDVDRRLVLLSILADILALALDNGSERIVLVLLHGFHGIELVRSTMFVGVEYHIDAIGHVIAICRHALEIVSTINGDSDLSI